MSDNTTQSQGSPRPSCRPIDSLNYYRDPDGNIIGPDVFVDGKPYEGTPLRESDVARERFTVEHRLTIRGVCPADGTTDAYNCLVTLDRVVSVEAIFNAVEMVTFEPAFQEDITRELAGILSAEVVTHGIHSGVYTTCRCSA